MRLMFPKPSDDKVISLKGDAEAVRLDLTENQFGIRVLKVANDLDFVFRTQIYVGEVNEPDLKPNVFIFSLGESGDLGRVNNKYVNIYREMLSIDAGKLQVIKSKNCDIYAEHSSGSITRAIIVTRQSIKSKGSFSDDYTSQERRKIYNQYLLPVEICATKAAIALNGGWGVFDVLDSSFSYSIPSNITSSFGSCFGRLNTSSIRPGMNRDRVRKILEGH